MKNVDAQRVMSVLNDTADMLRFLSYITPPVLDVAEQLGQTCEHDAVIALVHHRECVAEMLGSLAAGTESGNDDMAASTRHLCRIAKVHPQLPAALASLSLQRSLGILYFLSVFSKLLSRVQKRLTTTVEEASSRAAALEELCRREDKASKEQANLEQQLRAERRERAKALAAVADSEKRTSDELALLQAQTGAMSHSLEEGSRLQEEADRTGFQEREVALTADLLTVRTELEKIQNENREKELVMRKKKKTSEEEVVNWLHEYDGDMGSRMKQYLDEKEAYEEIHRQLTFYQEHYAKIEAEEAKRQEEERRIAEKQVKEAAELLRRNNAASTIQKYWKQWKAAKEEAAKLAKKSKGKEGKKKGGKKK